MNTAGLMHLIKQRIIENYGSFASDLKTKNLRVKVAKVGGLTFKNIIGVDLRTDKWGTETVVILYEESGKEMADAQAAE